MCRYTTEAETGLPWMCSGPSCFLSSLQRGGEGKKLAVQIEFTHRIEVHQRQGPDAAAHQGFRSPGTDAPESEHRHMALGKPDHRFLSQQSFFPDEPLR